MTSARISLPSNGAAHHWLRRNISCRKASDTVNESAVMVTQHQGSPDTDDTQEQSANKDVNPRDTDHPAGAEHAAENADEESPS